MNKLTIFPWESSMFSKKLTSLMFLIGFASWCGWGAYDLSNTVDRVGINPVIKVSGYLNNTSSFVLFGFFLPSIPMALLNVFLYDVQQSLSCNEVGI